MPVCIKFQVYSQLRRTVYQQVGLLATRTDSSVHLYIQYCIYWMNDCFTAIVWNGRLCEKHSPGFGIQLKIHWETYRQKFLYGWKGHQSGFPNHYKLLDQANLSRRYRNFKKISLISWAIEHNLKEQFSTGRKEQQQQSTCMAILVR